MSCFCGRSTPYAQCCQPYHQGLAYPATPEALMRSRYSAYCLANIAYIQRTMRGKASQGFDPIAAELWAERVVWIGLEVKQTRLLAPDEGQVEFMASFVDGKQWQLMHEISEFSLREGRWYYVDGCQLPVKSSRNISQNTACPCGSQKKWKQCHGKP